MTRKQALQKSVEILKQHDECGEVVHKLEGIINEMPLNHWTKDSIIDSFKQFESENNRNATTTDMKRRSSGLPPHPVIKLRFGITAKEFIDMYFPSGLKCNSKIFGNKTKEEWLSLFKADYENIKPSSAEEYNNEREKGLPTWQSVARLYDVKQWSQFQKFSGVTIYSKLKEQKEKNVIKFSIKGHSDIEDEFQKLSAR